MKDSDNGLTRRRFLKGAALGTIGASIAGSSLAGFAAADAAGQASSAASADSSMASQASSAAASSASSASSAASPDAPVLTPQTAGAFLNPQDYDYTGNSITDFSTTTLFSPWQLGKLTIPNRMVKSAAGSDTYVHTDTMDEMIAYYTAFAKGGIGMVWVENFASLLSQYPVSTKKDLGEYDAAALVDAVHEAGAYVGYQFDTMGTGVDGAVGLTAGEADNLTPDVIATFQADVIAGAKRLCDLGFDAFEFNAAGNNCGRLFFSRLHNHRADDYGPQSIENRARFTTEIISGIKEACGPDFVVQVLINGIEENDQNLGDNSLCTTVEENKEICKLLEAAGADSIHVRLGPNAMHVCQFASDLYFGGYGIEGTTSFGTQFDFARHWEGKLIANHSGCGMMLDVASEIKSAVSIPVGTVTYMDPAHAPDYFEQALKDGKVDFLIMNRPLTVDTEYVNKLKAGRLDEIAPCTRCLHCHMDKDLSGENTYEHCRVNACIQRALREDMPEGYDPLPADGTKNVMVVGGGPAGMEAARIAAQRGYTVTLYEKNAALGGLLAFANIIKGPHENLEALRSYLVRQQELAGVTVVTGQEVDADFIKAQAPDVVICATGGKRDTLGLDATEKTQIISIDDIMSAQIGQEVTIVGANEQAFDVALYLIAQGKHITMVFPDTIGMLDKGQSNWMKTFVKPMLFARGSRAWPQATITAVGDGQITINGETGVDITYPCDTIIEALDDIDNTEIISGLDGITTYAVGDCNAPWTTTFANIAEAIAAGNLTARKI